MAAICAGLALSAVLSRSDPHGLAFLIGLYAAGIGSMIALVGYALRWAAQRLFDHRVLPKPVPRSRALSQAGFYFTLSFFLMMVVGGIGELLVPRGKWMIFASIGVLIFVVGLLATARALVVAIRSHDRVFSGRDA
jgi:hypothetical protein